MKRSPFALLCALLLVTLRQRPADPALAAALARPGIDWPRLVTLSGVHLLTPPWRPRWATRRCGRRCRQICCSTWTQC
ncbi:MAG: hypothetical protein U1E52_18535 [Geminicoccaceae bacterium]